jgi:hypothetical protein
MRDNRTPDSAAATLGPMRPTEILGGAWTLYRRRWRTLLAIMAIAVPVAVSMPSTRALPGPGSEYQVIVHHRAVATTGSWAVTALLVLALLVAVAGFAVVVGAVARAAAVAAAGEDLGVRRSYRFGVARVWPLVGVVLAIALLVGFGSILLVIPGVIVGVLLAAAVPSLVVEGRRWRDALSRSSSLVTGHWWHSFGTLLLTWLLLGLATNLVDRAAGWLLDGRLLDAGWLAQTVAQAVSLTLVAPFAGLVGVLLYLDLRARKEPLDADVLRRDLQASGT